MILMQKIDPLLVRIDIALLKEEEQISEVVLVSNVPLDEGLEGLKVEFIPYFRIARKNSRLPFGF